MKELSFEKMEEVNGGISMEAFACGMGIVAIAYGGWWLLEVTIGACILAYQQ